MLEQWKRGCTTKNRKDAIVKVRPFTLRLPEHLYLAVTDRALASGKTQNATVIELVEIGLGAKMDVRQALLDLLAKEFPDSAITSIQ